MASVLLILIVITVPSTISVNAIQRDRLSGGTLKLGWVGEPANLFSPAMSPYTTSVVWMFSGMLQWDEEGRLMGDLAEEWSLSPDGRTLTYVLKEGLKFSDGHPITSADVAFSVEYGIEVGVWAFIFPTISEESTETNTGFALIEGALESPDERTIIYHLSEPSSTALTECGGYYVYPKHIFEGHDITVDKDYFYNNLVSSGVFKLKEYVPGSHWWLERNEYYHTPMYLDDVIFRLYSDYASAEIALINEEIDHIHAFPTQDWMMLSQYPQLELQLNPTWGVTYIPFNLEPIMEDGSPNPCVDISVRKAIYHAIDIPAVLDATVGAGFYEMVSQTMPVFVTVGGYSAVNESIPVPLLPYDPDAARAFLKDAGYEGKTLHLKYLIPSDFMPEVVITMAQFFESYLAEVGIDLEIIALESTAAMAARAFRPGPFWWHLAWHGSDCSPDAWVGPVQSLHKDMIGIWNIGAYNNSEINELLDVGFTELDDQARANIYKKVASIAARDVPILWLYNGKQTVAYNEDFRGWRWIAHPMQGIGHGLYPLSLIDVYYVPIQEAPITTTIETVTTIVPEFSSAVAIVMGLAALFVPIAVTRRRRK